MKGKVFPCELFKVGPYPFSEAFLKMQERRRKEQEPSKSPSGESVKVPTHYWDDLKEREVKVLCGNALAVAYLPQGIILTVLGQEILVDLPGRGLKRAKHGGWERFEYPLLELLVLVYLLNAGPESLSNEMVTTQQLKDAHFFQGPHELRTGPLLEQFGHKPEKLSEAAVALGGEPQDLADLSYRIKAFPKIPITYLLWRGDDEFEPRMSVLFDRSIERHLSADAIWGLVNLVTSALLRAPGSVF